MFSNRRMLSVFVVSAALAAASLILDRSASADLTQCSARPGALRLFDFETGHCGYVIGNNRNWGVFGWSDRADQVGNDGPENACLYDEPDCHGTHVLLPSGFTIEWRNPVWSNTWVAGSSCPASC